MPFFERAQMANPTSESLYEAFISLQEPHQSCKVQHGLAAFLGGAYKDGGGVLIPAVAKLTVAVGRIDITPEGLEQLRIGDSLWVINDPDDLEVACGRRPLVGKWG